MHRSWIACVACSALLAGWGCDEVTFISAPSGIGLPTQFLRDDFNAPALDTSIWMMPEGEGTFVGRTQFRPPSRPLQIANGVLRLQLDTYNPTAVTQGDSFWGSEIVTRQTFQVGGGLRFTARVRVPALVPGGIVASVFSYALTGAVRDEIDFEVLTNDPTRILTNLFSREGFSSPGRPQFIGGFTAGVFNDLTVEWRPTSVKWAINGQFVREVTERVPVEPMTIRLNVWAPAADFPAAYNALLQPAASAGGNQVFIYEVEFVEIAPLM